MSVYHFIGIKGTGMSALAQILHDSGKQVQGSDIDQEIFTQKALEKRDITILPFSEDNIEKNQIIIAGNAFGDDHEEIAKAKELKLPFYRYHDFLGEWLTNYTSIGVTGVHGKTSTTGLLAHTLGKNIPTSYLIGDGTGYGDEDSQYFVFEACEYRRHFLAYEPDYLIMTNIDFDHPDYFKDIEDVFDAFQSMALNVKQGIIACGDDDYLKQIYANVPVVYYGLSEENDFQAKNVQETDEGTSFEVYVRNTYYETFIVPQYGTHAVLNALSVIALCHYENFNAEEIKSMKEFGSVKRRCTETHLILNQILIYYYAHHPTEIKATIDSARKKYRDKEVVAVFQPHTFTRTKQFLEEFAESLSLADHVYLCDIFGSARESDGALRIEDLQERIENSTIVSEEDIEKLKQHPNSVLLFMGAGDIQKYEEKYKKLT